MKLFTVILMLGLSFSSFAQVKCGKVTRLSIIKSVSGYYGRAAATRYAIGMECSGGVSSLQVFDERVYSLAKEAKTNSMKLCRDRGTRADLDHYYLGGVLPDAAKESSTRNY